jgi:hypothetical protein
MRWMIRILMLLALACVGYTIYSAIIPNDSYFTLIVMLIGILLSIMGLILLKLLKEKEEKIEK